VARACARLPIGVSLSWQPVGLTLQRNRIWMIYGIRLIRRCCASTASLDWGQLTKLLREAAVYIGPDTSMTHLAAGSGRPTVALYGPASPHRIGPWPIDGLEHTWKPADTIQRRSNIWVVQNPLPCLPCEKLGCERHLDSHSECLDQLSLSQVLTAVDQALAGREAGVARFA
jgi:heptosyltransferase-3